MSHIAKLDPIVVNQIAAGEVVERPASVVKELLENALDAGATRIEVRLSEGGTRSIEIRDDGHGIAPDELELAVTSHATSKLRAPGDLESVGTLGFRGEALASIASVSRLELRSRRAADSEATSIRVDHGHAEPPRAASGPVGTRITVEDLFAGVPARRKFLKKIPTELSHCQAWVERLALAHVGVGFRLWHEDRSLLDVQPDDDLAARCAATFGAGLAERMIRVTEKGELVQLEARIGPPESARRNASRVQLFLNGRWVRDPALLAAVRQGMGEYIPHGQYPALYLAIAVPPDRVDVNVHPQKTEVRFRDGRLVVGTVIRALQRGLANAPWATRSIGGIGMTSGAVSASAEGFDLPDAPQAPRGSGGGGNLPLDSQSWERPLSGDSAASIIADAGVVPARGGRDEALAVGAFLSVHNTFLVREVPGGVEIIDQHALHERVNLEELRREVRGGSVVRQPLLVPEAVDVSGAEMALLEDKRELLLGLGFDIEPLTKLSVQIRSVPARLQRLQPEAVLRDLLEIAAGEKAATQDAVQERMLHTMACRGAVMAGDRLDAEALQDLLRRGANLPQDKTCAHGRPVRVLLSIADLEKAFHRR